MALTAQACSFEDILEAIRLHLVEVTELNDNFVRSVAADNYEVMLDEYSIGLRPLNSTPFTNSGAGRRARPERRPVRVYLHVRSSLDQVGSDKIALGKLIQFENTVNDALDEFMPLNDDEDAALCIEPLHPIESPSNPPTRKTEDDIGFVTMMLCYEVVYVRPNNTPAP